MSRRWLVLALSMATPAAAAEAPAKKKGGPRAFEVFARAFARTETNLPDYADDPSLEHLRLGANFRHRGLRVVAEADWDSGVRLRDVFVRLRGRRLGLRAGQLKPPSSIFELDSRWDLPTADRGLTTRVLVDGIGLAGRRPGIEAEWLGGGKWDLSVRVGAFRPSHARGDLVGEGNFDNGTTGAPKLAARVAVSPSGVGLGIFAEARTAQPIPDGRGERAFSAGIDLHWQRKLRRAGLRVWAEALTGSSWLDHDPFDGRHARLASARVLAALRLGGRKRSAKYVEAYARAGGVDADTSVRDDLISEWAAGVNVGLWNRVRLTLESRHESISLGAPRAVRPRGAPPKHDSIVVQLGVQP